MKAGRKQKEVVFRRQVFISGYFSFVKNLFEAESTFYLFFTVSGKCIFFSNMCSEVVNLTHTVY